MNISFVFNFLSFSVKEVEVTQSYVLVSLEKFQEKIAHIVGEITQEMDQEQRDAHVIADSLKQIVSFILTLVDSHI